MAPFIDLRESQVGNNPIKNFNKVNGSMELNEEFQRSQWINEKFQRSQ
ncbi:910_t:CDS:2 [Dentiscutata heterogama]|uniref:910_t:CDS:1 n=1 Tax=Dentiscutata heterogama TaxID=1316150 RepID=A0ACA9NYS2_9GLOM|nr:910_t:CDS:2 [Dentiscutata heterogama]